MAKMKGGLGRGLESLFGDSITEFEPVSVIAPDENKVPEVPESKSAAKAAAGKNASKKAGASAVAKGSKAASKTSEKAAEAKDNSIVYIKLSDIKPNSKQPRTVFDEEALDELAASIKEHGLIQPILVRPAQGGYKLVACERRWRAAHKAELKEIPAIVRVLDDRQNMFFALIENMQREDLNALEEARGIQEIMESYGLTQEEAAKSIGRSRPYVANALRLLKLPEQVQKLIEDKKLSAGHAKTIAGLSGSALQLEAAEKAVKEGWSVRQIENYAGKASKKKPRRKKVKDKDVAAMEDRLAEILGTKVRINGTESRGRLELDYYSRDELDRLIETLLGE